jgi:hypothetical protein
MDKDNNKIILKTIDGNVKKVYLFVMSACPFGNLMENIFYKIRQACGDFNFEPIFIVSKQDNSYSSLHGPDELKEDAIERHIINTQGVNAWLDFVYKANKYETADKMLANISKGLPYNISDLNYDYEIANKYNVSGSPTIVIVLDNNKTIKIEGMRDPNYIKDIFNLYGILHCEKELESIPIAGRC